MKIIGLIGGMTWSSTLEYYRIMNETVKEKLGGSHSAKCILYSVDFSEIEQLALQEKWRELADLISTYAQQLTGAGAEFIVICANTIHIVAEEVQNNISIPLLHIVDATAEEIIKTGVKKVGLLGTKFTMEKKFYTQRLTQTYGIDVSIPLEQERGVINDIIYKELSSGILKETSKQQYLEVINTLLSRDDVEGIILGCTEIPLLLNQDDIDAPVFDTVAIHAKAAVEYALQ